VKSMYIPLHIRLTVFYALILGLALYFFGTTVYNQARDRAYHDLDAALKSRAESVQLGKDLIIPGRSSDTSTQPRLLSSVDGLVNKLGTDGIAIEVLDDHQHLIATTTYQQSASFLTGVVGLGTPPVPWDARAVRQVLQGQHCEAQTATKCMYSTIVYQHQTIRVYTLVNEDFDALHPHIIQTARSQADIEQSLNDLKLTLFYGALLVMVLALAGGWLISWSVLRAVQRMTRTARIISDSHNFNQHVSSTPVLGRDELTTLATTFNQMLASLEEVYQYQQRFVADASHELRAPITSIRCNLDLLVKAPDLSIDEIQAALADARTEAERMGRLVNDLLLLARTDSLASERTTLNEKNILPHYTQEIDLDSLLLDVFRQYRYLNDERQGPRLSLQHTMPVSLYGNADQLKQAIVALVDNALKYTPQEGYVSLSLNIADEFAIIKIRDTGIGISPEELPHIFERFYRADRARPRDRGGSGLGLAIVQGIVRGHQGSIEVESIPGKGSTFTLKLPIVKEQQP
jgi:two-component system, OmpR family, sensor kinase